MTCKCVAGSSWADACRLFLRGRWNKEDWMLGMLGRLGAACFCVERHAALGGILRAARLLISRVSTPVQWPFVTRLAAPVHRRLHHAAVLASYPYWVCHAAGCCGWASPAAHRLRSGRSCGALWPSCAVAPSAGDPPCSLPGPRSRCLQASKPDAVIIIEPAAVATHPDVHLSPKQP
jgi:hypothetical protein